MESLQKKRRENAGTIIIHCRQLMIALRPSQNLHSCSLVVLPSTQIANYLLMRA